MDIVQESQLIEEVRRREIIWNKNNKLYINSWKKKKEWDAISSYLEIPKPKLRAKWKALITKFKSEYALSKLSKSGNGLEDQYISEWPHFQSMLFLVTSVEENKTSGNLTELLDDSVELDNSELVEDINTMIQNNKGQNKKINTASALLDLEEKKIALVERALHQNNQNYPRSSCEDDMLYFQTLMPHVAQIDPIKKLHFRNDVNKLVHSYTYPDEAWQPQSLIQAINSNSPIKQQRKRKRKTNDDDDCVIVKWDRPTYSMLAANIKQEKKYVPNLWDRNVSSQGYREQQFSGPSIHTSTPNIQSQVYNPYYQQYQGSLLQYHPNMMSPQQIPLAPQSTLTGSQSMRLVNTNSNQCSPSVLFPYNVPPGTHLSTAQNYTNQSSNQDVSSNMRPPSTMPPTSSHFQPIPSNFQEIREGTESAGQSRTECIQPSSCESTQPISSQSSTSSASNSITTTQNNEQQTGQVTIRPVETLTSKQ